MFAMLDTVFFTVVKGGLTGQKRKYTAVFADHEVFLGKPQTQAIGMDLDDLELTFELHHQHGSVLRRINKIKELQSKQEPIPYVMGNGRFVGVFTIRELEEISAIHDDRGGMLGASLEVKLKEYAGEMPNNSPMAGIVGDVLGALGVSEDVINMVNDTVEMVESAINMVNTVIGIIDDATEVIDSLKTSSNPLIDLLALGGVLGQGKDLCTQVLGYEFPEGNIFGDFISNVDKTGGFLSDILNLTAKAEAFGDVVPYMSQLSAVSDNLATMSAKLPVNMAYMKAQIAGREI